MDAKLSREISDWFRSQNSRVIGCPMLPGVHVLFQQAVGLVDSREQHHLVGSFIQSLGRELLQQCNRIVIELSPSNRIKVAEQMLNLGIPRPPQIASQRHALVVIFFN